MGSSIVMMWILLAVNGGFSSNARVDDLPSPQVRLPAQFHSFQSVTSDNCLGTRSEAKSEMVVGMRIMIVNCRAE